MIRAARRFEILLVATSLTTGLTCMLGAWAIAIRGRTLPWTLEGVVEAHRGEPLLFFAMVLPGFALAAALNHARAMADARSYRESNAEVPHDPPSERRSSLPLIPDGLIVVDGLDRVIEMNPAAELMFGCASTEAAGAPANQLLRDPVERATGEPRRSSRGEVLGACWSSVGYHRDGTQFDVEVAAVERVRGQTRTLVVRDRLSPRSKRAGSSGLIGTISREIRRPTNLVHASAEIALHNVRQSRSADIVADLERIFRGCRRLQQLADDLLDLSGLESIGGSPREYVDVVGLCGAMVEELQLNTGSAKVELQVRNSVPPVRTDADKLGRMLMRMIRCALGAREEGSLSLVIWSTNDSLHLEARGARGERPPELGELDDRIVEIQASALMVDLGPANDSRYWRLSIPLGNQWSQTPNRREDLTVPLTELRASTGPASYGITDVGEDDVAASPAPALLHTIARPSTTARTRSATSSGRRGRRSLISRQRHLSLASGPTVQSVAVLDPHSRSRRRLDLALSEQGFHTLELEAEGGLVAELRQGRPHAVVAQVGSGWQALAEVALSGVSSCLSVLALDTRGESGCRLRVDSIHTASHALRRMCVLASSIEPPGTAVLLLHRDEERRMLALALEDEGWSVVATAQLVAIEHRLQMRSLQLLVVDPTIPGAPELLARLHRNAQGVEHVALHLHPDFNDQSDSAWVDRLPERMPFSELVTELSLELASAASQREERR